MYELLYNPLSSRGKNFDVAKKLKKKLEKQGFSVNMRNLIEITNVSDFLKETKKDTKIVIVGGDGTLHRIVNTIDINEITCEVYLYKAGSGNDFIRSLNTNHKLIRINEYLKEFPTLTVNNEEIKVVNGAGIGLDGMVCARVNRSKREKNKSNYFINALISFFKFKPVEADISVDGKNFKERKLWFATTMYAPYFGGGMKIAPKKKRLDGKIQLVLVKNVPKFILLLIFPTIYLGWHRMFKSFVTIYDANEIEVKIKKPSYFQVDGEDKHPIDYYKMTL